MYEIYTDGACKVSTTKRGGWGICVLQDGKVIKEFNGTRKDSTNNQMELAAIYKALEFLWLAGKPLAVIYTDSEYSKKALTVWYKKWEANGWKNSKGEPVKNATLIKNCLGMLQDNPNVTFKWVKGHSGDFGNERADTLAREASEWS